MKTINLAVVGVTGMVGQAFLKILEEKKVKINNFYAFASEKSAGREVIFNGKRYVVDELTKSSFDCGIDIALFSAGAEISKIYAPIAVKKGCIVIDNSSHFRMDKDVPLVVPEVNSEDIKLHKGIIANPNCSTIQAMIAIKPLYDKYKIKRIVYSTYQAVSGAGVSGVQDLENGSKGEELKAFLHPIQNNCIPHIDVFLDNGYTKEEMKMIDETKKILHDETLKITATAVRVPVVNCHSEAINIEFFDKINIKEIKKCIKEMQGAILLDDCEKNEYPLASIATGTDHTYVGRIRRDESVENGINMFVVADNIRKGASTNAVQIAEYVIKNLI